MLARKRIIKKKGFIQVETPLLVPSFSSKLFIKIDALWNTIWDVSKQLFTDSILVSAYDIYYDKLGFFNNISFPELIILDSGGYECSKDFDTSNPYYFPTESKYWDRKLHCKVVNKWQNDIQTILVSFDHPSNRISIAEQIKEAEILFQKYPYFINSILLKPEKFETNLVNIDSIIKNIDLLSNFDIIGLTEKEIGNSIEEKLKNVMRVRTALDKKGYETPIHLFGSLDPMTSPLFFLAGADIFDGLTWLRFSYYNGKTIYANNYDIIEGLIKESTLDRIIRSLVQNNNTLLNLRQEMKQFVDSDGDFKCFGINADILYRITKDIKEA